MKSFFTVFVALYLCNLTTSAYEKSRHNFLCGKYRSSMIIKRNYNGSSETFDKAYLIHPRAVLTLAYAVDGLHKEELEVINPHKNPNKTSSFNVSEIIIHPEYNPCIGRNGIAILILQRPVKVPSSGPICLPDREIDRYNGRTTCSRLQMDRTFFKYLNADNIKDGSIGTCPNMMSHEFYSKLSNDACKLDRSQILDLFQRRESTFRTCKLHAKQARGGDIRQYLHQYYYVAPFCSLNEDRSNDYYVVYYKEDIYDSVPWIHSVMKEAVWKKVRLSDHKKRYYRHDHHDHRNMSNKVMSKSLDVDEIIIPKNID